MQLYHHTILQPTSACKVVRGSFTKYRVNLDEECELVVARTSSIELYRVSVNKPKLVLLATEQLFANICQIDTFTIPQKDRKKNVLLLTLQNGKLMILEYNEQLSKFIKVQEEDVFRTNLACQTGICKPYVGYHLAINDTARLVSIAAVRNAINIYEIYSSVLRGFKTLEGQYICYSLATYDTPLFYTLQSSVEDDLVHKELWKYAVENENVVVEKVRMSNKAHMVIALAKEYYLLISESQVELCQGKDTTISLRVPSSNCSATLYASYWRQKLFKKQCICLVSEFGDIFALSLDKTHKQNPNRKDIQDKMQYLSISYIMTISLSLCVVALTPTLLFSVSENDHHNLLQIEETNNENRLQLSSTPSQILEERIPELIRQDHESHKWKVIDRLQNLGMLTDMKIVNDNSLRSDIYTITSFANHKGTLSLLRHGLRVVQKIAVSFQQPLGIWCLRNNRNDANHSTVVLAFARRTTCLNIQQNNLIQIHLGLEENERTLCIGRLHDDSLVQITISKIRHIRKDNTKDIPFTNKATKAVMTDYGKQIAVALSGAYVVYYQLDKNDTLVEAKQLVLNSQTNWLDLSPLEPFDNQQVNRFMLIAQINYVITLYSLYGSEKFMTEVLQYTVKSGIEALALQTLPFQDKKKYLLSIGLANGALIRLELFSNGQLEKKKQLKQSDRGFIFSKLTIAGQPALMKLSTRPTLSYYFQQKQMQCALALPTIDLACEINIENCSDTFLAYYQGYLRVIALVGFGKLFHRDTIMLEYSARKLFLFEKCIAVLGCGHNSNNQPIQESTSKIYSNHDVYEFQIFLLKDISKKIKVLTFPVVEKCVSVCYCKAQQTEATGYLCFGCVSQHSYHPPSYQAPCVKVYQWHVVETKMTHLYTFELEEIPSAMAAYNDKLLIGVGNSLRLYEFGRSKLLLKGIRNGFGSIINGIHSQGEKIFVTEVMDSFSLYRRDIANKTFDFIAEDILPRYVTVSTLIDADYGMLAGADKFGNLFVSKITNGIKDQFYCPDREISQTFRLVSKFESLVNFHVAEMVTAIQVGKIEADKRQVIIYSTIDGRIAVLYPFEPEQAKLQQTVSLVQTGVETTTELINAKQHPFFRSYYSPVKGVVDGDLCQFYRSLSAHEQRRIAQQQKKKPEQILSVIETVTDAFL